MNLFKNKKITKNLIIILVTTIMLSGLLPNFVQAKTDTDNGGNILAPIEQFVVFLCDSVMQWLQKQFTSIEDIAQGDGTYNFQYSPAIIFSGTVPALDINFINPEEPKTSTTTETDYISVSDALELGGATQLESKEGILDVGLGSVVNEMKEKYGFDEDEQVNLDDLKEKLTSLDTDVNSITSITIGTGHLEYAWYNETANKIYVIICEEVKNLEPSGTEIITYTYYNCYVCSLDTEEDLKEALESTNETVDVETTRTYESTAGILQSTIATWYNVLSRIALVGLLSVLLYVGIRIVISSSVDDKAKYKGMLKDWLVALCLLFTLHYIMSATIAITNNVSDIFETGETDELLNTLRAEIHYGIKGGGSWGEVLALVIMYATLVIFTIVFTVQYIGRVIYMAFYTLMAPLITLTYPLDKIKDGQAQAFSIWIREYVYTALVQIIHLIIYSTLVGSALSLVMDYPLYAIIVLFFIKKAEDIIKKMFGFDKSETVGTLGAAATGAIVMNAINKIPHGASGGKGKGSSGGGSNGKAVRTKSGDPLDALRGGTGSSDGALDEGAPEDGSASPEGTRARASGAGSGAGDTAEEATASKKLSLKDRAGQQMKKALKSKPAKGTGALFRRYGGSIAKGVAKGFIGGTGAIIGFSAGVAQGDIGAALGGALAGGKAGTGLVDWGANKATGIGRTLEEIGYTFNEGAYGKEEAQNMKFDKQFMKSAEYRELRDSFDLSTEEDKEQFDANVHTMLAAGITDQKAMKKILNGGDSIEEAMAYYTLAHECDDSIYYDDAKLQAKLESLDLSETDARKMREKMRKYR